LILPLLAGAQPGSCWHCLIERLRIGKDVVVNTKSAVQLEGRLLDVAAESITLRIHGKPLEIAREDVFRVRYADIRRKNTLVGLVTGAGVGCLGGLLIVWLVGDGGNAGAGCLSIGIIGLATGSAAGGSVPIGEPLYEAGRPRVAPQPATAP
jgi:hypothetical protein